MGFREDLTRRIERKRAEILELETQIRLAKEYLQALEDTLKLLPKDGSTPTDMVSANSLRPGTSLAKARDAIRKAGRPLHITELLPAVGKGTSRNDRAGLSGTLSTYVRKGEIFTRPAPNTFGLMELLDNAVDAVPIADTQQPPAGFGKL